MAMPNRTFATSDDYRYGFNGKEKDKDISEGGQDYGMRIYDARLGRFLSVDPLSPKYPMLTPYQFASNRPIDGIDEDGLEYAASGRNGPNQLAVDGFAIMNRYSCNLDTYHQQQAQSNAIKLEAANTNHYTFTAIGGNGNAYHGSNPSELNRQIRYAQALHHIEVGEYIRQEGFLATVGYAVGGEKGMYIGGAVGNVTASVTGLTEPGSSSVLSVNKIQAPRLRGSGTVSGVIELNSTIKSSDAFSKGISKTARDFVYDPTTGKFAMAGNNATYLKHYGLRQVIGGKESDVVGGRIKLGANGEILTSQWSGTYGSNWTPEIATRFKSFIKTVANKTVDHSNNQKFKDGTK